MIKNIFFDFDGVLLDSVSAKTEAFKQLYSFAGTEVADKVVAYHLQHGGVSRYDKIRYWHKEYLSINLTEEEVNIWANKFAELALQNVLQANKVAGAYEFLQANFNKYKCWIITGTPTDEIRFILEKLGWANFFVAAYGSPEKKNHWTEFIINKHQLNRSETVFIGDALADKAAADFSSLHFILRETDENIELFNDFKGIRERDLLQLEDVLVKWS